MTYISVLLQKFILRCSCSSVCKPSVTDYNQYWVSISPGDGLRNL